MGNAIGDAQGVNLNTAPPQELERIGGLGDQRAQRIVENRPFNSWEDLKRVEGFSDKLVQDLQEAGATLGDGSSGGQGEGRSGQSAARH